MTPSTLPWVELEQDDFSLLYELTANEDILVACLQLINFQRNGAYRRIKQATSS